MAKNNVTIENWLKNVAISCKTIDHLMVTKELAKNAFYRMKLLDIPGFNSVLSLIKSLEYAIRQDETADLQ